MDTGNIMTGKFGIDPPSVEVYLRAVHANSYVDVAFKRGCPKIHPGLPVTDKYGDLRLRERGRSPLSIVVFPV